MTRFLFAVAAVALLASVGSAEEKPTTTPPVTATPVIVGTPATTVVESAPATSSRRGLFSRLRNRGTTTATPTYTTPTPVVTTPGTVTTPAPTTTTPVPAPMPMPGTKSTPGAMAMPNGIIVVGGTETATPAVTTANYSEPAQRRGLFGRTRNR